MTGELSDRHRGMLEIESAISPEIIAARGYQTVTVKARLTERGFKNWQARVPALLIPVWGVSGDIVAYQARPDSPRIKRGKAIKYETPDGAHMVLDVPRVVRERLCDPSLPLWITEGAKKADSASSRDLVCIALLGVWNWRGTNDAGGKTVLADFESIALNLRTVYIAFDSDMIEKNEVRAALLRFGNWLASKGATVRIVRIMSGESGAKVGLDDFFAASGSVDELIARSQRLESFEAEPAATNQRYVEREGAIYWRKSEDTETQLTNFTARVVADVIQDDGTETRRVFELEAMRKGRLRRFTITAERFAAMNWPVDQLGASAIIYPGITNREHTRVAIQTLSDEVAERSVYAHTGWREIGGRWVYLSASGGIGAEGFIPGIEVRLPAALDRFALPEPPQGDELAAAIRASMAIVNLLSLEVSAPLYAAIWRSALTGVDFSLHLSGATGQGKTELAALCQQHYGADMDARHLPGSWSSTGNALEGQAFIAKDALFVADDFAPGGTLHDIARLHREADRFLRAAGNQSGRERMRADSSLRPAKPPRCLVLSTGEDVPMGSSLRARLFVLDVELGAVDFEKLTRCQHDARNGLYAQALAGFVQWLAKQRARGLNDRFQRLIGDFRSKAADARQHRRTPAILADLAAGLRLFVDYAVESRALTADDGRDLWARCWIALGDAGRRQADYQSAGNPANHFRECLIAALASGKAHLADRNGFVPSNRERFGWRYAERGEYSTWQPLGERIGWETKDGIYLEPRASLAVAQSVANRTGEAFAIGLKTLNKRLYEQGWLATVDLARETLTVRRTLSGGAHAVLHVLPTFFDAAVACTPERSDKTDIPGEKPDAPPDMSDFDVGYVDAGMAPDRETDRKFPATAQPNGQMSEMSVSPGVRNLEPLEIPGMSLRLSEWTIRPPRTRHEKPTNGNIRERGLAVCRYCGAQRIPALACPSCGLTDSQAMEMLRKDAVAGAVS